MPRGMPVYLRINGDLQSWYGMGCVSSIFYEPLILSSLLGILLSMILLD